MTTREQLTRSNKSFTEIRDERREVCLSCDKNMTFKLVELGMCKSCGCYTLAKTMLPFTNCPEDKWTL